MATQSSAGFVPVERYGVREQTPSGGPVERAIESLRTFGYAIYDAGFSPSDMTALRERFDAVREMIYQQGGGRDRLTRIDEQHTLRAMLAHDASFLELARHPDILAIARQLVGDYIVLNQQNGVINPGNGREYNQGKWHRDLPYQHFVSSRPLAINALFCVDEFTHDNGATLVAPASHKMEAFPSDEFLQQTALQAVAPAGHFIILDAMTFHSGAVNRSPRDRRAVNHVYTIPMIRQQIDLPAVLGADYRKDDSAVRSLLGYGLEVPRSVEEYYLSREQRVQGSRAAM